MIHLLTLESPLTNRELRAAISRLTTSFLSRHGRESHNHPSIIPQYGPVESLAYAASQSYHQFCLLTRVLREVSYHDGRFQPHRVLHYGSGTGMGLWAVNEVWRKAVKDVLAVEISDAMVDIAETILKEAAQSNVEEESVPVFEKIQFTRYMPHSKEVKYDLVLASNVLSELPNDAVRSTVAQALWEKTGRYIVLVEPGSSYGSKIILNARQQLLDMNECHMVAPCPHRKSCPKAKDNQICSFPQRSLKDKDVMKILNTKSNRESRTFSFVILEKSLEPRKPEYDARVLDVVKEKQAVKLNLCRSDGTMKEVVMQRDDNAYKQARKLHPGDVSLMQ